MADDASRVGLNRERFALETPVQHDNRMDPQPVQLEMLLYANCGIADGVAIDGRKNTVVS